MQVVDVFPDLPRRTVDAVVDGSMNVSGAAYRYTQGYAPPRELDHVPTFRMRRKAGAKSSSSGSSSSGSGGIQSGSVALLERKICGRLGKVFS